MHTDVISLSVLLMMFVMVCHFSSVIFLMGVSHDIFLQIVIELFT